MQPELKALSAKLAAIVSEEDLRDSEDYAFGAVYALAVSNAWGIGTGQVLFQKRTGTS